MPLVFFLLLKVLLKLFRINMILSNDVLLELYLL
jgi:hypothetical protein